MICHRPIRRLSAEEERDRRDALEHERYHEVKDQIEAEMRAQYEEDFGPYFRELHPFKPNSSDVHDQTLARMRADPAIY